MEELEDDPSSEMLAIEPYRPAVSGRFIPNLASSTQRKVDPIQDAAPGGGARHKKMGA